MLSSRLNLTNQALCWTLSALLVVEAQQNFFGQHIGKSDRSHLTSFMKIMYGAIILYTMALTSSKLSLLALYWRIFRGSTRQWPIIIAVAVNIVWMLITVSCDVIYRFPFIARLTSHEGVHVNLYL